MARNFRVFVIPALGSALACAVLASQPAYAEQLSCGDVTLQEGTSGDITCTFTNNTSGDININSSNPFSAISFGPVGIDATDSATLKSISGSGSSPCTAGETLSAGTSCGLAVRWTTDNPAGETDKDVGVQVWEIGVVNNSTEFLTLDFPLVTVNDPAPVPEPASAVLLGSGVLGVFGLLRRKLL